MRLIDADALGVGRCSRNLLPADYCAGWNGLIRLIEKAPTVDAVEVVRCKGCEHAYESFGRLVCGHSIYTDCLVREDFFCADGVTRKENEKKDGAEC